VHDPAFPAEGTRIMRRFTLSAAVLALAACSGPRLPPPNSAQAVYDRSAGAVYVTVSSVAPPTGAALVSPSGARYQAAGLSMLSSPHVAYNPPPSIGVGFGGLGFVPAAGSGRGSASACLLEARPSPKSAISISFPPRSPCHRITWRTGRAIAWRSCPPGHR
jgi:hypothetical protein